MKNLLNKRTFLIFGASLFLFGCSNNEKSDDVNQKVSLEQKQQNIQTRNTEALDEAKQFHLPILILSKQNSL